MLLLQQHLVIFISGQNRLSPKKVSNGWNLESSKSLRGEWHKGKDSSALFSLSYADTYAIYNIFMDTSVFSNSGKALLLKNHNQQLIFRPKERLEDFYALEIGPADTTSERRLIFTGGYSVPFLASNWNRLGISLVAQWLRIRLPGLPWWRSGWESACQCRGHGFEPWSGKIPRAAEQLGPWATITKPARLEPVLLNKRGHDSERPAHCDEEWPPLATSRESPRTETKTQHSHK